MVPPNLFDSLEGLDAVRFLFDFKNALLHRVAAVDICRRSAAVHHLESIRQQDSLVGVNPRVECGCVRRLKPTECQMYVDRKQ